MPRAKQPKPETLNPEPDTLNPEFEAPATRSPKTFLGFLPPT